jgi:phage repressor protein C with HTH and peptisase S24 domain
MESVDVNFTEIMERVSIIMESELGIAPYDKNIASELSMSPTQYANNKRRNKIPYFEITNFCHKHGITINWILLGESSMKLIQREEEIYKIRLIEKINASCGGGGFCDEEAEAKYIYIDKNSASKLGIVNSENIEAINAVGDSMIPTIKEESTVLVDRTKNMLNSSGVYVVNTVSGLFIKRLALNPNGGVDLISDNKNYDTITMPIDEVTIVGKVVGSLEKI